MGKNKLYQNQGAENEANRIGARFANSSNVVKDMGNAFGYDFSNVKLHDDDASDNYVRSKGKDAVASGDEVFFGKGMLSGKDPASNALVGHELTHIMQQDSFAGVSQSVEPGVAQGGLISFFKNLFKKKKNNEEEPDSNEANTEQVNSGVTQIDENEEKKSDSEDNPSMGARIGKGILKWGLGIVPTALSTLKNWGSDLIHLRPFKHPIEALGAFGGGLANTLSGGMLGPTMSSNKDGEGKLINYVGGQRYDGSGGSIMDKLVRGGADIRRRNARGFLGSILGYESDSDFSDRMSDYGDRSGIKSYGIFSKMGNALKGFVNRPLKLLDRITGRITGNYGKFSRDNATSDRAEEEYRQISPYSEDEDYEDDPLQEQEEQEDLEIERKMEESGYVPPQKKKENPIKRFFKTLFFGKK